jgi:hypothetical protein
LSVPLWNVCIILFPRETAIGSETNSPPKDSQSSKYASDNFLYSLKTSLIKHGFLNGERGVLSFLILLLKVKEYLK